MLERPGRRSIRFEGSARGEQLEQQDAEPVDIRCSRWRFAANLFRCGMRERQQSLLRSRVEGKRRVARDVEQLRDAEIEQPRRSVRLDENVRRFDVAMHHQASVRELHRARDREKQSESFANV